jgi:hypothetical protein
VFEFSAKIQKKGAFRPFAFAAQSLPREYLGQDETRDNLTKIVILCAQISHGVRRARTIFQWKIVSVERTNRKVWAG